MKSLNLILIGAGNIALNRHLPFLKTRPQQFKVVGIADHHLDHARAAAARFAIPLVITPSQLNQLSTLPYLKTADAIIITTPPDTHEPLLRQALDIGKPILVEKPFVINLQAGQAIIRAARRKKVLLAVNQNFQFASAFQKLKVLRETNVLGDLTSLYLVQYSNDKRRLPQWSEKLPLGLFYDETPHFMYLTRMLTQKPIHCVAAELIRSTHKPATPKILTASLRSGRLPIHLYLNFESPLCEWFVTAFYTHRFITVDLFRDILINLPSDGIHLGKQVMQTSLNASAQHWAQVVKNGYHYAKGDLWWGFDQVYERFYHALVNQDAALLGEIGADHGLAVNRLQHEIIKYALSPTS